MFTSLFQYKLIKCVTNTDLVSAKYKMSVGNVQNNYLTFIYTVQAEKRSWNIKLLMFWLILVIQIFKPTQPTVTVEKTLILWLTNTGNLRCN